MNLLQRLMNMMTGAQPCEITEDCLLIDVRSPSEFANAHLDGTINLPLGGCSASDIQRACPDTSAPIILFCASGMRSSSFKQLMEQIGYTNVKNAGGIGQVAVMTGRPVIRG